MTGGKKSLLTHPEVDSISTSCAPAPDAPSTKKQSQDLLKSNALLVSGFLIDSRNS